MEQRKRFNWRGRSLRGGMEGEEVKSVCVFWEGFLEGMRVK